MTKHILSGLYISQNGCNDASQNGSGAILQLTSTDQDSDRRWMKLPVELQPELDAAALAKGTGFLTAGINRWGRAVICASNPAEAAIFAISHLLAMHNMRLPDAFALVAPRLNLSILSTAWTATLSEFHALPYPREAVESQGFFSQLFHASASAINHVYKGIYLSGIDAMYYQNSARDLHIRAVLRLDNGFAAREWGPAFDTLHLPISDGRYISDRHFDQALDFIHNHAQNKRSVLVHCQAGISRSVTMVLAYLIQHGGMKLPDAYDLVARNRPVANPHPELRRSLIERYNLPYHPDDFERGFHDHDSL